MNPNCLSHLSLLLKRFDQTSIAGLGTIVGDGGKEDNDENDQPLIKRVQKRQVDAPEEKEEDNRPLRLFVQRKMIPRYKGNKKVTDERPKRRTRKIPIN